MLRIQFCLFKQPLKYCYNAFRITQVYGCLLFQGDTVSVTFYGVNPRIRTRVVSCESIKRFFQPTRGIVKRHRIAFDISNLQIILNEMVQ